MLTKRVPAVLPEDNLFYGLRKQMTDEQLDYVSKMFNYPITFSNSGPGTGKTTLAVAVGKFLVDNELSNIDGLVYLFNPIEEGKMGFRPGTQEEKEFDYLGPLKNALIKINQMPHILGREGSWIEAKSHTFDRGINIMNKFVIIDEAQNWTKSDLKKTLTRIDDTCTTVVIGHTGQIDLENPSTSGFEPYMHHFKSETGKAAYAHLTKNFRGWLSTHADAIE